MGKFYFITSKLKDMKIIYILWYQIHIYIYIFRNRQEGKTIKFFSDCPHGHIEKQYFVSSSLFQYFKFFHTEQVLPL